MVIIDIIRGHPPTYVRQEGLPELHEGSFDGIGLGDKDPSLGGRRHEVIR